MAKYQEPETFMARFIDELEESCIAIILGLMVTITFINVVLRYGFNTGLIWGLEATSFLFAWLVLFGVSYAVKKTAHLGVDALINIFSPETRRIVGLISAAICIIYSLLLLKGAWDYWANFANLPKTTGHWFPTGFEEMKTSSMRSWYEVVDTPMPEWLRFIEPWINENEAYEKIPRFIPYFILPFGMALMLFRFCQAGWRVWTGEQDMLIVSHEAEDAMDDVAHLNKD